VPSSSNPGGLSKTRLENITAHIERNYIAPGKIAGCQVAVARRGDLAYFGSFGEMDREKRRPMADDAIFRIYSMTKPITSVALMTLYEQGYFQLNDPVEKFFPAWRNKRVWLSGAGEAMITEAAIRPPSMLDMLRHTSGLTYGGALTSFGAPSLSPDVDQVSGDAGIQRGGDETLTRFMDKLSRVPLLFQPGERWMYSYATDVCGALVERISGRPFDRYLKEAIFDPLGMNDTAFQVSEEKAGRLCANYLRAPDKTLRLYDAPETSPYLAKPTFLSGGGGLTSTTHDYLRFCEMLRRGGELDGERILGPRTVAMMHRNYLKGGADLASLSVGGFSETVDAGVGFGLGFASVIDAVENGSISAGDFYWGGLASTIFWVDQAEDLSVVFMTQLIPSATFNFRGQLKSLIYSAILD
jgi:CubicO group peptidase (beta-lactamase class C family)